MFTEKKHKTDGVKVNLADSFNRNRLNLAAFIVITSGQLGNGCFNVCNHSGNELKKAKSFLSGSVPVQKTGTALCKLHSQALL